MLLKAVLGRRGVRCRCCPNCSAPTSLATRWSWPAWALAALCARRRTFTRPALVAGWLPPARARSRGEADHLRRGGSCSVFRGRSVMPRGNLSPRTRADVSRCDHISETTGQVCMNATLASPQCGAQGYRAARRGRPQSQGIYDLPSSTTRGLSSSSPTCTAGRSNAIVRDALNGVHNLDHRRVPREPSQHRRRRRGSC